MKTAVQSSKPKSYPWTGHRARQCGMKRSGLWGQTSLGWRVLLLLIMQGTYSLHISGTSSVTLGLMGKSSGEKFSRPEQKAPLRKRLRPTRRLGINQVLTCTVLPLPSALARLPCRGCAGRCRGIHLAKAYGRHRCL